MGVDLLVIALSKRKLDAIVSHPERFRPFLEDPDDSPRLSMPRTYSMLATALTGAQMQAPPPYGDAIYGGTAVTHGGDHFYYITFEKLYELTHELLALTEARFGELFEKNVSTDPISGVPPERREKAKETLWRDLALLTDFYTAASGRKYGAIKHFE